MKRPNNVTLERYYDAKSSTDRTVVVLDAFNYIEELEKENNSLRKNRDINNCKNK